MIYDSIIIMTTTPKNITKWEKSSVRNKWLRRIGN